MNDSVCVCVSVTCRIGEDHVCFSFLINKAGIVDDYVFQVFVCVCAPRSFLYTESTISSCNLNAGHILLHISSLN